MGVDLDLAGASTDEIYACMDWLVDRQAAIEAKLAHATFPASEPVEDGVVRPDLLLDERTTLRAGRARLLPRRQKRPLPIEYGMLTDPDGRPVAMRVFPGNTADPTAFTHAEASPGQVGLTRLVLVGDRGMITSARITALGDDPDADLGWFTALRAPAISTWPPPTARYNPPCSTDTTRRDQPPRLPRGTPDRLPQPLPGRRAGPQTQRAARRHRDFWPPSPPRSTGPTHRGGPHRA